MTTKPEVRSPEPPAPQTVYAYCANCGKEIRDPKAFGVRAYCCYECYCDD